MKKIAKITLMLAVYLVWVCSNSVIALSCYANHDKHIHCCAKSCDCHHDDWEKAHFESPHGCHHDHSNRIALYDISKEQEIDIKPVINSVDLHLLTPLYSLLTPNYSLLTITNEVSLCRNRLPYRGTVCVPLPLLRSYRYDRAEGLVVS